MWRRSQRKASLDVDQGRSISQYRVNFKQYRRSRICICENYLTAIRAHRRISGKPARMSSAAPKPIRSQWRGRRLGVYWPDPWDKIQISADDEECGLQRKRAGCIPPHSGRENGSGTKMQNFSASTLKLEKISLLQQAALIRYFIRD